MADPAELGPLPEFGPRATAPPLMSQRVIIVDREFLVRSSAPSVPAPAPSQPVAVVPGPTTAWEDTVALAKRLLRAWLGSDTSGRRSGADFDPWAERELRGKPTLPGWGSPPPSGRRPRAPTQRPISRRPARPSMAPARRPPFPDADVAPPVQSLPSEKRRLVYSQQWRRDDPPVQLAPGTSTKKHWTVTSGVTESRTQALGTALGMGAGLGSTAVSASLRTNFAINLTLRQETSHTSIVELNNATKRDRRYAIWAVVHRVEVHRLPNPKAPASAPRGLMVAIEFIDIMNPSVNSAVLGP